LAILLLVYSGYKIQQANQKSTSKRQFDSGCSLPATWIVYDLMVRMLPDSVAVYLVRALGGGPEITAPVAALKRPLWQGHTMAAAVAL
jgi:hypothetical protein